MYAQVLTAKIKKDSARNVENLIDQWKNQCGRPLNGCREILVSREENGSRISIIVLFDNKKALDDFSQHPSTLKLFEDAKQHVDGRIEYFEAAASQASLT